MNKLMIMLFFATFMVACASKLQRIDDVAEQVGTDPVSGLEHEVDAESFATKDVERSLKSDLLGHSVSQPLANVIYFQFDSSNLAPQNRNIIQQYATYLLAKPNTIITLSGHADERGSREYNLALGEQRANAVKRQLIVLGVSSAQIGTISYGEEKPVADAHNDVAWSKNRRVEITY